MTREPLTDDQVTAALADLVGWRYTDGRLTRTTTFDSFADAIAYVNRVAAIAEEMDHHPDIDIRYRDVTLSCWTHTTGGVTTSDIALARRC